MKRQPMLLPVRTASGRVVAPICKALRVTTRALIALWLDRRARGREVPAFDGIAEMNEYMLKDIGAARWMVDRAEVCAARLSMSFLAVAFITTGTSALAGEPIGAQPRANPIAHAQSVGIFTGEHVNGAPVYRFPVVTVIANRKAELASMEREERLARAKQARSKVPAKPPA